MIVFSTYCLVVVIIASISVAFSWSVRQRCYYRFPASCIHARARVIQDASTKKIGTGSRRKDRDIERNEGTSFILKQNEDFESQSEQASNRVDVSMESLSTPVYSIASGSYPIRPVNVTVVLPPSVVEMATARTSMLMNDELRRKGHVTKGFRKKSSLPSFVLRRIYGDEQFDNSTRRLLSDAISIGCMQQNSSFTGYFEFLNDSSLFLCEEDGCYNITVSVLQRPKIMFSDAINYSDKWRKDHVPRWSGNKAGLMSVPIEELTALQQHLYRNMTSFCSAPSNHHAQPDDVLTLRAAIYHVSANHKRADSNIESRHLQFVENKTLQVELTGSDDLVAGLLGCNVGEKRRIFVRTPIDGASLFKHLSRGSSAIYDLEIVDIKTKFNFVDLSETSRDILNTIIEKLEKHASILAAISCELFKTKNATSALLNPHCFDQSIRFALLDNTRVDGQIPPALSEQYAQSLFDYFIHQMQICGLVTPAQDRDWQNVSKWIEFENLTSKNIQQEILFDWVCRDIADRENIVVDSSEILYFRKRIWKAQRNKAKAAGKTMSGAQNTSDSPSVDVIADSLLSQLGVMSDSSLYTQLLRHKVTNFLATSKRD
jgi:hypothetical protein